MNKEQVFYSGACAVLYVAYSWQGRHVAETLSREMGWELRKIAELGADTALLALLEQDNELTP